MQIVNCEGFLHYQIFVNLEISNGYKRIGFDWRVLNVSHGNEYPRRITSEDF